MSSSVKNLGGGNSSGTTLNLEYLCDSRKYGNSSIGYSTWVAFEDLQRDRYDEYIITPQEEGSWGSYVGKIGLLAVPTSMSSSSKGMIGVVSLMTNYRRVITTYELTYNSIGGVVGLIMDGNFPFKVYGVVKEE